MADEEHEVYGANVPFEGEMDGDVDMPSANEDDVDKMNLRSKKINEEAAALRQMHSEMAAAAQDPAAAAVSQENKEEADARSVYVGNVDYACTPEEVQHHFESCGTVNRVTILTDKFGQPKGFAYVEFLEVEAVQEACVLTESEFHGWQLKVLPKRTNVPGMKQFRPRRFNPSMDYHFRSPYVPPYFYSPYGYGLNYAARRFPDSEGRHDTCPTTRRLFRSD